jgi:uncharacterized protein YxjI
MKNKFFLIQDEFWLQNTEQVSSFQNKRKRFSVIEIENTLTYDFCGRYDAFIVKV